jgi:thiosulfate/3-mercaptopyruvate sulfurtransferase
MYKILFQVNLKKENRMKEKMRFDFSSLKQLYVAFGICLCLTLTVSGAYAGKDRMASPLFVDARYLMDHLEQVVVVDTRSEKAYGKGHIPGAVSAPWQPFTHMAGKPGDPGWGTLLSKEELAAKIGALGIDGGKPLVVYADPPGWGEDGRFVWMAVMAGIENVHILDGGLAAWKKAGGQTTRETASPSPLEMVITQWDGSLDATTGWILANQDQVKIVDSRSLSEFNGATKYGEARGGHLPGAVLISFDDMFEKNGLLKSPGELTELFERAGLQPEDTIVTYCTAGIRSAHMALVLRMAGFVNARNYDASFYEWAGMKDLLLEK